MVLMHGLAQAGVATHGVDRGNEARQHGQYQICVLALNLLVFRDSSNSQEKNHQHQHQ